MTTLSRIAPWIAAVVVTIMGSAPASASSCPPPGGLGCGLPMDNVDGITAYSNGSNQCSLYDCGNGGAFTDPYGQYGERYQCVEFTARYFAQHFGESSLIRTDGTQYCNPGVFGANVSIIYGNPQHGDVFVRPCAGTSFSTCGHVAIVDRNNGDGTITVVQQNSGSARENRNISDAVCFVRYSPPAAPPPPPPGGGGGGCGRASIAGARTFDRGLVLVGSFMAAIALLLRRRSASRL